MAHNIFWQSLLLKIFLGPYNAINNKSRTKVKADKRRPDVDNIPQLRIPSPLTQQLLQFMDHKMHIISNKNIYVHIMYSPTFAHSLIPNSTLLRSIYITTTSLYSIYCVYLVSTK